MLLHASVLYDQKSLHMLFGSVFLREPRFSRSLAARSMLTNQPQRKLTGSLIRRGNVAVVRQQKFTIIIPYVIVMRVYVIIECYWTFDRSPTVHVSDFFSVWFLVGLWVDAGWVDRPAGFHQDVFVLRQFSTEMPPSSRRHQKSTAVPDGRAAGRRASKEYCWWIIAAWRNTIRLAADLRHVTYSACPVVCDVAGTTCSFFVKCGAVGTTFRVGIGLADSLTSWERLWQPGMRHNKTLLISVKKLFWDPLRLTFPWGYFSHRRCLLTILGIPWRDHVISDELMKRAGMRNLSNIIKMRRLTLAGHILRLLPDRPASVDMEWVPGGGKRRRGRPSRTWRQTF